MWEDIYVFPTKKNIHPIFPYYVGGYVSELLFLPHMREEKLLFLPHMREEK